MIGICIKNEQRNYGSKLQALATLKAFRDLGYDYKIIKYGKGGILFKLKSLPRIFNIVFLNDRYDSWQKAYSFKKHPEVNSKIILRNELFKRFDEEHFNKDIVYVKYFKELQKESLKYTSIVTCSDQLWSPAALGTNFYNLMFVSDKVNKVSYASSFGVSKIPWYQINRTRKYLNRIDHISVRENKGKEIVKDLTGKDVPVLMDPVFIYTKEEWQDLVPYENVDLPPYILCYFLGANLEYRKSVKSLADKLDLKIVTLPHLDRYVAEDEIFADYALFDVDPKKFLNLIRCAKYVCTDSFHGCAFSIIEEKEFFIFNRYSDKSKNSKNSRIDTVCENLGLSNRRVTANDNLYAKIGQSINYTDVKLKLEKYINKSKRYLKESLK